MARTTTPQVVRSYFTQLETALVELPTDVREEILAGIREELDGLDASAAAARIEALGDPEFIAAEARSEAAGPAAGSPLVELVEARDPEPRWLPVLAALLVAFGGIVIPFVGWIVGIAMVWMSKTWRIRDKWIATLTPFIGVAAFILLFALTSAASQLNVPSTSEFGNPLIPGMFSAVWSSAFLVIPVNAVVGIWLLWRAKRVWSSADRTQPGREPANAQPRQQGSGYPVVTVLLLILGGVVVPVLGWAAGVAMLWAADVWSIRDKWLGTLAGPVAILAAGLAMFIVRIGGGESGGLVWWHAVLLGGVALPVVANLLVGIRLLRRSH
jgi:hypothetical protein